VLLVDALVGIVIQASFGDGPNHQAFHIEGNFDEEA